MNATGHACYRYCERIIGMPTKSISKYLEENREEIQGYIRQLVEASTFLYYGKTDSKYPMSSYYIVGDIILITRGKQVQTLYRIKFNLPPGTSGKILKNLVNEILRKQKLQARTEEVATRKKIFQNKQLSEVEEQIVNIRQRLKNLEKRKREIICRIELIESKPREIDYDIQLIMQQLCGRPGDKVQKTS